jgi:predicted DNA-binding transcriptional regulator YafY
VKNHDKIATRLAIILTKLNASERFTVEELVEEFGVTKRTIQRDLNERLSYLPIKKENNHYYLETYYLGKLNFDDIKNFSALSGIRELFPSLQEDFLKNILDTTVNQAYLVKGHNYEDLSDKTEMFNLIENAINSTKKIKFLYKEKERDVSPYKLVNIKGIWYLAGMENTTLKTFTLSKISDITVTIECYTIQNDVLESIEAEDSTWFSDKKIEVVLKVESEVAEYFKRRNILPNQTLIKKLEDGGVLISSKISFDEEILKLIRYWIPHVSVVSPVRLQTELEGGLQNYLSRV